MVGVHRLAFFSTVIFDDGDLKVAAAVYRV